MAISSSGAQPERDQFRLRFNLELVSVRLDEFVSLFHVNMELFDLEPDSDRPDEIKYYTYTGQYRNQSMDSSSPIFSDSTSSRSAFDLTRFVTFI